MQSPIQEAMVGLESYQNKEKQLSEIIKIFIETKDWRIKAILVQHWQCIFRELIKESIDE